MKILVCDSIPRAGIEALSSVPGAVVEEKTGLKEAELCAVVAEVDAIVVRSATKVTKAVIEAGLRLKAVVRAGMGYDNIDLAAATAKGVLVMNTPGRNASATAEHAVALMMALARHIPQAHRSLQEGVWEKKKYTGTDLAGKTLGVVGLGNVGREVVRRAKGLLMNVVGYDPFVPGEISLGIPVVDLDSLYASSDFITLHAVLNDRTHRMIDREALKKMKSGVRIINCARGALLDEEAVLEGLESGRVAGVALDVFETEPLPKDSRWLNNEKVVVTPHLGASTAEAQEQVALAAAEQLRAYLTDGVVVGGVNVPSMGREVLAGGYIALAERMGSFLGQLDLDRIMEVSVECTGAALAKDLSVLTSAALCGFMKHFCEHVNMVNAVVTARESGIRVESRCSEDGGEFTSLMSVRVRSRKGSRTVSGTVFGVNQPRIVVVDSFRMEVVPQGHLLLIHNEDVPGVVGRWATVLGDNGINISQMQLALDPTEKRALSVVNVDAVVAPEVVRQIESQKDVLSLRSIRL